MNLTELYCHVDDFWKGYAPQYQQQQLSSGVRQRQRAGQLAESEIMTIMIHFHQAHYRHFKAYYTEHVQVYLQREFPQLVSYSRLFSSWRGSWSCCVPICITASGSVRVLA